MQQRSKSHPGQGLLGNAPVGFGTQIMNNNSFNNQNRNSHGGMECYVGGGDDNSVPGSGCGSLQQHRGFGSQQSHKSSDFANQRMATFSNAGQQGNISGTIGHSMQHGQHQQPPHPYQQRQPDQQQRQNDSGHGPQCTGGLLGKLPIQQYPQQSQHSPNIQYQQHQQRQLIQQPSPSGGAIGTGGLGSIASANTQQLKQMMNANRDSQLALVNSLLKGSLLSANNMGMASAQTPLNANPSNGNIQSRGIGSMAIPNMGMGNMVTDNAAIANISNLNMVSNNNGNIQNGNLGQFGPITGNRSPGGTGTMGMASPGGPPMMALPSNHPGFLGNNHNKSLMNNNNQGVLGNQQSLLGNPSLPRTSDFMPRESGGLFGRSVRRAAGGGRGGGNQVFGPQIGGRPGRNISNTFRFRPDRRGLPGPATSAWTTGHRRRHDSLDSRDSHNSREARPRYSLDGGRASMRDELRDHSEKRQVVLPPGGGSESLRVRVTDGQQEYDPAEPTEDNAESASTSESTLLVEPDRECELAVPETISSPTTDHYHAGQKRPRSHSPVSRSHTTSGDLKVTVDEKGRSVQDGPHQAKRRESVTSDENKDETTDQKFTCYACSVDCKDIHHFESHMRSNRHRARMESICNLHVQKTDQQLARMRAEEHLRRIEGRDKEDYCRICDKRFVGSFITHRRGQEHRRKERLTKRGCKLCRTGSYVQYCDYVKHIDSEPHKKQMKLAERPKCSLCGMSFRSPKTFVAHCKTEGHRKNKEELRRQEHSSSHSHEGEDEEEEEELDMEVETDEHEKGETEEDARSFPDSLEELVTVDATGIYKETDNEVVSDNDHEPDPDDELPSSLVSSKSLEDQVSEKSIPNAVLDSMTLQEEDTNKKDMGKEEEKVVFQSDCRQIPMSSKETVEITKVPSQPETRVNDDPSWCKSERKQSKSQTKEKSISAKKDERDQNVPATAFQPEGNRNENVPLPAFHPEVASGQEYVFPVTGFFCKLCQKFYTQEHVARVTHCKTRSHFDRYLNDFKKGIQKKGSYGGLLVSSGSKCLGESASPGSPTDDRLKHTCETQSKTDWPTNSPVNGTSSDQDVSRAEQSDIMQNGVGYRSACDKLNEDTLTESLTIEDEAKSDLQMKSTGIEDAKENRPQVLAEDVLVNGVVSDNEPEVENGGCEMHDVVSGSCGEHQSEKENGVQDGEMEVKVQGLHVKPAVKRSSRVRRGRVRRVRAK